MALDKLTKPRARWTTFKLKIASAISRSLYEKMSENISVLDFGADPTGTVDSTAAIQAAIDFVQSGTLDFVGGTYLVSKITIQGKNSNNGGSLGRLYIKANGATFNPLTAVDTELLRIGECKRLTLEGLHVQGRVNICGLWDSRIVDCWFSGTVFGDETWHTGFCSHYWNLFENTRLEETIVITSGTRVTNHEFNANTAVDTIIGRGDRYALTIRGTGSMQGFKMFGGEFRGDLIVEEEQPLLGVTPNSLHMYGTYFDGSNDGGVDRKGFQVDVTGSAPAVNNYTFDSAGVEQDSELEQSMVGSATQSRIPTSGVNLCPFGNLEGLRTGYTDNLPNYYNFTEAMVDDALELTLSGTYAQANFTAIAPHTGWYAITVCHKRFTGDPSEPNIRYHNITTDTAAYGVLGNDSPVRDKFILGSLTKYVIKGEEFGVKVYGGGTTPVGGRMAIKSVSITFGMKAQITTQSTEKGKQAEFYDDAEPTTGTFVKGERVWNTNPTTGQPIGWVCTVDGTPGTWNAFGVIA